MTRGHGGNRLRCLCEVSGLVSIIRRENVSNNQGDIYIQQKQKQVFMFWEIFKLIHQNMGRGVYFQETFCRNMVGEAVSVIPKMSPKIGHKAVRNSTTKLL